MKPVIFSILMLLVSCSDWKYHRDLERLDQFNLMGQEWSNPAFSGTLDHIKSLEIRHAKRVEWSKDDDSSLEVKETVISRQKNLDEVLKSRRFRPWIKDHAIKLYQDSSFTALYIFPGLYRILVFFDQEGRSCETIRDP